MIKISAFTIRDCPLRLILFQAIFSFNSLLQVRCEKELVEAVETTMGDKKDCVCFIEVIVHKDDTSKELLEWGSRVSAANSRPSNPQ